MPKGTLSLTRAIRKHLREHPEDLDATARALLDVTTGREGRATVGEQITATKVLLERLDGGVARALELTGSVDLPLRVCAVSMDAIEMADDREVEEIIEHPSPAYDPEDDSDPLGDGAGAVGGK
jgi:hypothetical protein